jgi:hypothetical protein
VAARPAGPEGERRALGALTRWSVSAFAEAGTYAVAIVLAFWPGLIHARTEMLGGSDDGRYYAWLGWRVGRLIAHGHVLPVRITDVISPFGLDLRLLDGYLPSYVAGLYNLVAGPTLAYNLTFVTGAVLNVVAARSLARRLSSSRLVHTVSAVAFLTAPPLALCVQQGLLPLFWAFPVPLLVADALDVVGGKRDVRPVRLALLLVVAYLCSVYFLVFGGLAFGVIVGVAALRRHSWRIPIATTGAIAMTALALLPFIVPRLSFEYGEANGGIDTALVADSELFSADALSIVAQPNRATFLLPKPDIIDRSIVRLPDPSYTLEATIFPGLLLLAGFIVFLVSPGARRLPLALAALLTWLLALGPSLKYGGDFLWRHGGRPVAWLPYRALLAVPGLGALRGPTRVGEVLVVLFVAATAIALDRVLASGRVSAIAVAIVCAVLLLPNLLVPLPTLTMGTTAASEDALRAIGRLARPGDTVLRVPTDCDPVFERLQVFHHIPVLGCAGSFAANPWSKLVTYARSEALTKLRCDRTKYGKIDTPETSGTALTPFGPDDLARARAEFGVRFVVVERTRTFGCDTLNASLPFLEQHRLLGRDDRFEVLDLSARAQP